jgi:hypothetical protein
MKYHEWWSEAAGVKLKHPRGGTGGSAVLSHIVPSVELLQQVLHGVGRTRHSKPAHAQLLSAQQPTGQGRTPWPKPPVTAMLFQRFQILLSAVRAQQP